MIARARDEAARSSSAKAATSRPPSTRSTPRAPVFVRVKPLGAGKTGTSETRGSLKHDNDTFTLNGKAFDFPTAVIGDNVDQDGAYSLGDVDSYVADFLDGVDVNVLAYGQTGSGKTHTTFGPPGLMDRAGKGEFGTEVIPEYGLFPRALMAILDRLGSLDSGGNRALLTASAVELAYGMNMDMLFGKCPTFADLTRKPCTLYGQTEVVLRGREDALGLFAALATRNQRATAMNDSSSRSHCFVTLMLHVADGSGKTLRQSRLQFVDMAGSERLKDAHGNRVANPYASLNDEGVIEGMITNYSLMLFSQAIRDVAKCPKPEDMSFRTYGKTGGVELVFLLQASLTGAARTILYVCMHQSIECDSQTYNAADFGYHFATLRCRPVRNKHQPIAPLVADASAVQKENELNLKRGGSISKSTSGVDYNEMRRAQVRQAKQRLAFLRMLTDDGGGGGGGGIGEDGSLSSGGGGGTSRRGGGGGGRRYTFSGDSMFNYRLNGLWDEQGAQEQRFGLDATNWKKEASKPIDQQRKEFGDEMKSLLAYSKANKRYMAKQRISMIEIDTKQYGGGNGSLTILVHTPKQSGSPTVNGGNGLRKALIYFHGGGAIVGSAADFAANGIVPRMCCDSNAIVFNVDYRLAPEHRVPAGLIDGMSAIRYVSTHVAELGIDPKRIAVCGESGGAYIAVGACMELAKCNEAERVSLLIAISPQTSNFFRVADGPMLDDKSISGLRLDLYQTMANIISGMLVGGAKSLPKHDHDPLLYPNLMEDTLMRAMPKTVVFTSEFDFFRVAAEELAERLEANGRLLDYCCHPCTTHCWWMMMEHKPADAFWGDLAKVISKWL